MSRWNRTMEHEGRHYRFRFEWRRPKFVLCTAAERPRTPLILNTYPGVVIGIGIRLRGRKYLSVLWGRPGREYEVNGDRAESVRGSARA